MPFGLNSATEVFQKKNEEAFSGINGIHIMADDIIIAAATVEPLESIMQKPLCQVSPRLQRMLLKLQKYNLTVKYTRGKDMHIANALSRAHLSDTEENDFEEMS